MFDPRVHDFIFATTSGLPTAYPARRPASPNTFENVRSTTTRGLLIASGITVSKPGTSTYSKYASSTRIVVSGDARFTFSTNATTSALVWTVAVGLFGLQR